LLFLLEYEIENIRGHFINHEDNLMYYKVAWTGWPACFSAWIGEPQFNSPSDMLKEYKKLHRIKSAIKKRKSK
jgi:hypothetical protein